MPDNRQDAVQCSSLFFDSGALSIQGTLFFDYGTDLDSGQTVLGDPAGARGKPGSGYGYGAGIRVDSPVGPLRLEYAFNDKFVRRFHFGIGSHG